MTKKTNRTLNDAVKMIAIIMIVVSLSSCKKQDKNPVNEDEATDSNVVIDENTQEKKEEKKDSGFSVEVADEGSVIFYSSEDYYRYGPSIMKYEDGSMDAWFSSPGNSGSQWDWITYRHSEDGINWSEEEIVLRPTPGSKDQCSVCDPGVIYFDGYYYLAYTGTDYYEGNGSDNMAFVARSQYPDGPFEKWNGSGWGGYPEPIIVYEGDPSGWGVGEISFVIYGEDLFIYYSYVDVSGGYIELSKADLTENWPLTIRSKGEVLLREHQDSLDVVYDETLNLFLAFSIDLRMSEKSRLAMYMSYNGKQFEEVDHTKDGIEDYAHNLGVAKSPAGWIDSHDNLLIGYAYGKNWGRWNMRFQHININY